MLPAGESLFWAPTQLPIKVKGTPTLTMASEAHVLGKENPPRIFIPLSQLRWHNSLLVQHCNLLASSF